MSWRAFIRENRWQKLFSVGLAVLIWFTVRSTEGLRVGGLDASHTRVFDRVSITVLTSAADLGRYRVTPESVRVELRGDPDVLEHLSAAELEAYVNLVDLRATPQSVSLHVNPPNGTDLVTVLPSKVQVDRLADGDAP